MNSKHLLIMLACCLIPIALIFALGVYGISLGSLSGILPYALVLVCPLMMIFMMRDMIRGHGQGHDHTPKSNAPKQPSEFNHD